MIVMFIVFFVILQPGHGEAFGWGLGVIYIIMPLFAVVIFCLINLDKQFNIVDKLFCLVVYNVLYHLFLGGLYIDDTFIWFMINFPAVFGFLIGIFVKDIIMARKNNKTNLK